MQQFMKHSRAGVMAALLGLYAVAGCLSPSIPHQRRDDDALLFQEAQKALDARDYGDAIEKFNLFLEQFPKSPKYSWALQRLGESFEGLLAVEWQRRIERGEPRDLVTRDFLQRYGKYNVWVERDGALWYDKSHYRIIVEKFPDSPIADEAQYRMITLSDEAAQNPKALAGDVAQLEAVLEKYPTTSLRSEILYHIARRCRILYEIYQFSPYPQVRNASTAEQYRTKAIYAYKLCLKSPEHSVFAQKAWEELTALEAGKRSSLFE